MRFTSRYLALASLTIGASKLAAMPIVVPATMPSTATAAWAETRIGGRTVPLDGGLEQLRQWPATYFETIAEGPALSFKIGAGESALDLLVDGRTIATLIRPAPGFYRIEGLGAGPHRIEAEITSESQAGPTAFGGFFVPPETKASLPSPRQRQIEFIGDSHTVGYADLSVKQDCSQDEVWQTTDTAQAFGPMLARKYGADYQVNAISGRGVVRNYNGFAADTMPQAYPYSLFGDRRPADVPGWQPQVIVIALGTNDFSTPLHAGERWKTRDDLHADYEATYVRFVKSLRARYPHSFFLLWATDKADGEIEDEVRKVVATLHAAGETHLAYVPIDNLTFSACHSHPSEADEGVIATRLSAEIDQIPGIWNGPNGQPHPQ